MLALYKVLWPNHKMYESDQYVDYAATYIG
jgi:hypothetical protein